MSNNVYICQFSLSNINDYDIGASVKNSGFDYPDIKNILSRQEDRDKSDETAAKKEQYFPFALDLENTNHFSIQSKIVPDTLWIGIERKEIKLPTKQDYIFSIRSGGRIFNKACADILKQHRFGENILTPVQIYDLSTGKLVSDETYYFLNLYERRQYICDEQSDTQTFIRISDIYRDDKYTTHDEIRDYHLDIYKTALNCNVDLWHDDRLKGYFFMSENLHQALSQAGMIDKFNAHTCNLIE